MKISPDLEEAQLDGLLAVALQRTRRRVDRLQHVGRPSADSLISAAAKETGGSVRPADFRAVDAPASRDVFCAAAATMPIIGVGGVENAETALAKIEAGATLVQIYTGSIYRGPGLSRRNPARPERGGCAAQP